LTLVADGRALKNRWVTLFSWSSSAKTAADPAHRAKVLLSSWLEKPFGVVVVVPRTDWRDRVDWWSDGLWRERDGGRKTGEFEGVTLRDEADP
jgi:hypothetical protein